jgi:hypothetical protein
MTIKERGIYIGTIQSEPYGVPFDYEKDNLYLLNRFIIYLIQNKDGISERIKEQFSIAKAELFLSIINKYDEYEALYFLNLERIDIGDVNCDNLDFQTGNNCIVLRQNDIELIFPLPLNDSVEHHIIFNNQEVDFEKAEEYSGKKVNLFSDPDFPHIFMTESQIKSNNEYLTKKIDELLNGIGLDSNVSKAELAKILGEPF